MKASKATIGPTAAGTRTYVSDQQGHWGQPQGLTSMCDMYKGKRMGKSTNQQNHIGSMPGKDKTATVTFMNCLDMCHEHTPRLTILKSVLHTSAQNDSESSCSVRIVLEKAFSRCRTATSI